MSREFTIQSDSVPSMQASEILVALGIAQDTFISDAELWHVLYTHRSDIEKIAALLYRADAQKFQEPIEALIYFLRQTTRGTYKREELDNAISNLSSDNEELGTVPTGAIDTTKENEEQLLLEHKRSFGIKKKLNSAIQVRSLSSRFLEAVITLISAFPQESVTKLHQDTFKAQEALRALSSFLAFIRASLTIISATKHAVGYNISEQEKELTPLTRFSDQIKRNAPQLSRDIIWSIVRFIGWKEENLQKVSMELTLGLFSFVFFQTIAVQQYENRFYNRCTDHCEKTKKPETQSEALISALSIAKGEVSHQNNIQILIWFLYLTGALTCVIGKECSKTSEKFEVALGSVLIVLTCIGQILWERSKPNLMSLVSRLSELTTSPEIISRDEAPRIIEIPDEKAIIANVAREKTSPTLFKVVEEAREESPKVPSSAMCTLADESKHAEEAVGLVA